MDTLENTDLNSLLSLDDECKCESNHAPLRHDPFPEGEICSIKVVARKKIGCINFSFNICQNSYDWNMKVIPLRLFSCETCGRSIEACWSFHSI